MGTMSSISKRLAPRVTDFTPALTTTFVREALRRAIDGVGPLPPAAQAAEKQLKEQRGAHAPVESSQTHEIHVRGRESVSECGIERVPIRKVTVRQHPRGQTRRGGVRESRGLRTV